MCVCFFVYVNMEQYARITTIICLCLHSRSAVMAQASVVRPSSINSGFSETAAWIQAKFEGSSLSTILHIIFFQNFKVSIFLGLFFIFVNIGPYGSKTVKTRLLLQYLSDVSQTFMINTAVIRECKVMDILAICPKFKKIVGL